MPNAIRSLRAAAAAALSVLSTACSAPDAASAAPPEPEARRDAAPPAAEPHAAPQPGDALLAPWTGPYGGVPAFDRMQLAELKPALERAMERHLAEIDALVRVRSAPTFENTILGLERAGRDLDRVQAYFGVWGSNLSTPEFRAVQTEMAPRLSEHATKILQNEALFARVRTVWEGRASAQLDAAQLRLVQLVYDRFAHNGATLTGAAKERYAAIQKRLAELHTRFAQNVLGDEEGYVLYVGADQLGGLPDAFVQAAAKAAKERGHEGEFAITNTRSSMDPFLTFSDERLLRERVWRTYYARGDNGDERDNNALIAEILALRHERVKLLGYDSYASWRLTDRMAKTPERALGLMEAVWPAALARAADEVAEMQAVADAEGGDVTIEPWDYRYYAEKVRRAKYDLDSDEVRSYLQLDKLREAMFFVAGELFGFAFAPVKAGSVPVFHPDVRAWEVTDERSGAHVGLWYLDPYARPGKRSGAWATAYRSHETFEGKRTVLAANNSNFIAAAPGEPVLVSWEDAETFFHEFGHALHYLSSNVAYPTLNGGVRDYTEFQSQLLERWLLTEPVIERWLVHYRTGERIPAELVEKIRRAATFNEGFRTTEYLASALLDMRFHTVDPAGLDADAFERDTLAALGLPREIVARHRAPHFTHVFSSEGYAAGYYGYLWADVLTSDAAEAFEAAPGGYYDRELSARCVRHLFAPCNSVDPADAYRAFRGRDARIDALMRDRGFPVPESAGG